MRSFLTFLAVLLSIAAVAAAPFLLLALAFYFIEFTFEGLSYVAEESLPVSYNGRELGTAYRMDFVVEKTVVVEVKAIERVLPIHRQQLLTYLRLSGYPVGLLINFNVPVLKDGIVRVVNDRPKPVK